MAVKIRMQRFGRRNRPFYRIVAADARSPRDGRTLETLGTYNPIEKDQEKVVAFNEERVKYWLSVGAQPSETARSIFKKHGLSIPWEDNKARKRDAAVQKRRSEKGKAKKK
ncbi:MAG: 30S ribosomal protein S16 [Planctomycetota bacterium]|jgi:small subunit ribosomal protein S16